MNSAAQFRAEAAKCRVMAKLARDPMTARNLRALADDYEAEAKLLERAPRAEPPITE